MPGWSHLLIDWFSRHRRPMPWRETPSPYKVWISEIMLQQTQVATVIPYFERFLTRFPDVYTLAGAESQDVLKCWEGLGYYSRARHLQAAARQIVALGAFPSTAAAWKVLPGIGPYTAAAIASIAFGEPVPSIDGNVLRVYSRFRGIPDDLRRAPVRRAIYSELESALREVDPSTFNQAMMELGALVCRPKRPDCGECPLYADCAARQQHLTDAIPFKPVKLAVPHHIEVAAIIIDAGQRVLVYRRPERGLLAGLWEFPCLRREHRELLRTVVQQGIGQKTGLDLTDIRPLGRVNHAFSHFTQTFHVLACRTTSLEGKAALPPDAQALRWCSRAEIEALPMSKVHRTIAGMLLDRCLENQRTQ